MQEFKMNITFEWWWSKKIWVLDVDQLSSSSPKVRKDYATRKWEYDLQTRILLVNEWIMKDRPSIKPYVDKLKKLKGKKKIWYATFYWRCKSPAYTTPTVL